MKPRILLPLLLLLLFSDGRSHAQQTTDPKQVALAAYAHFKSLTPAELNQLLSKAHSGDAEAQFWVGIIYTDGNVPKNLAEGARWLLKSAEQGYAPAQRAYGLMSRVSNPSEGERWMLRAAEQGDTEARANSNKMSHYNDRRQNDKKHHRDCLAPPSENLHSPPLIKLDTTGRP